MLGLTLAPAAGANSLGTWTQVAPMGTPRFGAAAAVLRNGDVLVAGGKDASVDALSTAEIYDPSTNSWAPAAAMSTPRMLAGAATLPDGDVLVAGGQDASGQALKTAEIYDPRTNSWTGAPDMEYRHVDEGAVALSDGRVYVNCGSDSYCSEIYNPTTNSWTTIDGEGEDGAALQPLPNDGVLIAGGTEYGSVISFAMVYNAVANSETFSNDMSVPRTQAATATLSDGRVLVAGGSSASSTALSSVEMYDPVTRAWSSGNSMPSPRYGAIAERLPDGEVLIAGGSDGSTPLATAQVVAVSQMPRPVAQISPHIYDVGSQQGPSSGTRVGDTISIYGATWDQPLRNDTIEVQRCTTTCVNVESATSTPAESWGVTGSYTITRADIGAAVRIAEVATNADSSAVAVSNSLGPILSGGPSLFPAAIPLTLPGRRFGFFGPPGSIEVDRADVSTPETVDYVVSQTTPTPHPAFRSMTGQLYFARGQDGAYIIVPALDHGVPILPPTLTVQLYGGSPESVSSPSVGQVPVQDFNQGNYVRNSADPLNLAWRRPESDPLAGAQLFVDRTGTAVASAAAAIEPTNPTAAANLNEIVNEPNVTRFGSWNGSYPGRAVQSFLVRAQQTEPDTIPMLATYKLVTAKLTHPNCGHWADPPTTQAAYHEWITNLAEGIGPRPAILFLEMDSLITVGCLSHHGLTVRLHELHDAINVLSNDPHLVVYLDAGAADALHAKEAASLLKRAGVAQIQGFFLNSTHFDWTRKEIKYGEEISKLTGGKHFVINTAENGQGPLVPKQRWKNGNEVLCNPPGRGLGPLPTAHTGYRNVDAFAWIANPGVSGGVCGAGQPPGGRFSVQLALGLVRHANFKVR